MSLTLPDHLNYEEQVTHCLDRLARECRSVGVEVPDRSATEELLRSWGLDAVIDVLRHALAEGGKVKEWVKIRKAKELGHVFAILRTLT